jgi:hypothetical protein
MRQPATLEVEGLTCAGGAERAVKASSVIVVANALRLRHFGRRT